MLVSFKNLCSYTLMARDGEMGKVKDVYFDDASWKIRYFVVDTRKWLPGKKVLLSPLAICGLIEDQKRLRTQLSQEEVRLAPSIDEDLPVSRQHELALSDYFGWPQYWYRTEPLGYPFVTTFMDIEPYSNDITDELRKAVEKRLAHSDRHLRSCDEVLHYDVLTYDQERIKLSDFLVGFKDWDIPFLMVGGDLRHNLHLVPSVYCGEVSYPAQSIKIDLTENRVLTSPTVRSHGGVPTWAEMQAVSDFYFSQTQRGKPGKERTAS